jgi:hypothetical protein
MNFHEKDKKISGCLLSGHKFFFIRERAFWTINGNLVCNAKFLWRKIWKFWASIWNSIEKDSASFTKLLKMNTMLTLTTIPVEYYIFNTKINQVILNRHIIWKQVLFINLLQQNKLVFIFSQRQEERHWFYNCSDMKIGSQNVKK